MAPVVSRNREANEVLADTGEGGEIHRSDVRKQNKSCWAEGDTRSISPSLSLKSFHSAKSVLSGHSDIGDSGVSSERDSPSPLGSTTLSSSLSQSETDDSCGSSESLHQYAQQSQKSGRHADTSQTRDLPALPPKKDRRKNNFTKTKPPLPSAIFRQICERAKQFEERRQHTAKIDSSSVNKLRGMSIRSRPMSQVRMTHTSSSSQPPLLLLNASLFPSTPSLIAEEDETDEEGSLRTQSSLSCEEPCADFLVSSCPQSAGGLYEYQEHNAGAGFAGIKDIFSPPQSSTLRSCKGTVRGVRHRVRAGIATFNSDQRLLKVSKALYFLQKLISSCPVEYNEYHSNEGN